MFFQSNIGGGANKEEGWQCKGGVNNFWLFWLLRRRGSLNEVHHAQNNRDKHSAHETNKLTICCYGNGQRKSYRIWILCSSIFISLRSFRSIYQCIHLNYRIKLATFFNLISGIFRPCHTLGRRDLDPWSLGIVFFAAVHCNGCIAWQIKVLQRSPIIRFYNCFILTNTSSQIN